MGPKLPMIITCPNCGTYYDIPPNAIKPTGSMLRCARCHHTWQQSIIHSVEVREQHITIPAPVAPVAQAVPAAPAPPPPPPPEPVVIPEPIPEPEPEPEPEATPASEAEEDPLSQDDLDNLFGETDPEPVESVVGKDLDAEETDTEIQPEDIPDPDPIPEVFAHPMNDDEIPIGHPRFQQPQPKGAGTLKITLITLVVLLAAIAFGGVLGKGMVMKYFPASKSLYALSGLYTPAPGEGLAPRDITPTRDVRDGVEYLIVNGKVVNITDQPIVVPPLRVSLTNTQNKELAFTILKLNTDILKAGGSVTFKAEFKNPPGTARQMTVNFINPETMKKDAAKQPAKE